MKMIRSWFALDKREHVGYDVRCLYCGKKSVAWDFKHNAIAVGIVHVVDNHLPDLYRHAGWR